MQILEVENLSLQYGEQIILDQVSFSTKERKIVGLLGSNSAEQSSIIKILAGLVFPETGNLYFKK